MPGLLIVASCGEVVQAWRVFWCDARPAYSKAAAA